jgi:peptidoglycan/LPS O-acetylase OafA/YrhL
VPQANLGNPQLVLGSLVVTVRFACETGWMRFLGPVIGSLVVGIGIAIVAGGPPPTFEIMIATVAVVAVVLLAISERDEARPRPAVESAQAEMPEDAA